jgi:plasmid replication initiation protein
MTKLRATLSDWVFNAVAAREILTLSRDYFRLRKPLERRLYELARKHCGQQA